MLEFQKKNLILTYEAWLMENEGIVFDEILRILYMNETKMLDLVDFL